MAEILIVDDYAMVRGLIRQVLEHEPDLKVAGEAATAEAALQLLPTRSWDTVILDLSLPDQPGLEVLRVIKRDYPNVPALILSMQSAEQSAPYAREMGAAGYLMKEHAPDQLLVAVRALLRGETYFNPPY